MDKKVSTTDRLDRKWQQYLIKGLSLYTKNPFIMKELASLKPEVASRLKSYEELGHDMKTKKAAILHLIGGNLWMYYFIDWKIPEYYSTCLVNYIYKGTFDFDLIESPIHLVVGRSGAVLPKSENYNTYTKKLSKSHSAYDDSVYFRIKKDTKPKDIEKFIDVYFEFIEKENKLIFNDSLGKRYKPPKLEVLEVIADCLSRGVTDEAEIANELDDKCPKRKNDIWTPDAVRLRIEKLGKIHDKNPYTKSDYLDSLSE